MILFVFDTKEECDKSVSYTHLDVYKRQTLHCIVDYIKIKEDFQMVQKKGAYTVITGCLLYTSRCV